MVFHVDEGMNFDDEGCSNIADTGFGDEIKRFSLKGTPLSFQRYLPIFHLHPYSMIFRSFNKLDHAHEALVPFEASQKLELGSILP